MYLAHVRASNFRLFQRLQFEPHPRLNLITGDNAVGKTTLLEVVHCLARGRSFRTATAAELARNSGADWTVGGDFAATSAPAEKVRVSWAKRNIAAVSNDQEIGLASLIAGHPLQVIEPGLHRLVQEGPSHRRAYLDWGVFHVEPTFLESWRRYRQSLRQRNAALIRGAPDVEIAAWHTELTTNAAQIQRLRTQHLRRLEPLLAAVSGKLLGDINWSWELRSGWQAGTEYLEVLEQQLARDRRARTTVEGPHRAELVVRADGQMARQHLSRGQEKLLVCALVMAQAELITRAGGRSPILLVDDFAAELAPDFQSRLMNVLNEYRGQSFVTAFSRPASWPEDGFLMFHVEHGAIAKC